jgi:hypothetical protein
MRTIGFVLGMLVASQAMASQSFVAFINDDDDSVVSIEVAVPGSHDWRPLKFRGLNYGSWVSSAGGYIGSAEARINTDRSCVDDILIQFATHKALLVKGFNVCQVHSLYIGSMWRHANAMS